MPRKRIIIKKDFDREANFLKDFDMIYFINLENRKDRLENIQKKIDPKGVKTSRIEAIKRDIGAIGCGLSHIKTLKDAQKKGFKRILVLEDDFIFCKSLSVIEKNINSLLEIDFNICLLAGNIYSSKKLERGGSIASLSRSAGSREGTRDIDEALNVQTTSAYIINSNFYQTLIDNFEKSIQTMNENYKYGQAEIDVGWKKLQGEGKKFYIFNPKLGKQMISYSDIEKKITNYNC
jgi:glycosyl transferase family 25